jgi:H+/Cl- antiporter ClcA
MNNETGKLVIIAGVLIVVAGLIIYFFGSKLNWIGNLPGDIRIERENFKFYFPITTMILLSLLVNFIFRIFRWLN